jgi:thioredoxin-related protein
MAGTMRPVFRLLLLMTAVLTLASDVRAQTPPSAVDVVATAAGRAKAERKSVLIEFGASWCTWCRNFEAFVTSPDAGQVLARHFVVVNLTVHERDGKQALEHPGGAAMMDTWGGAKSGLPFYVFLDANGDKVADSNAMPDGGNIGFPAVPEEIRAFVALMGRAAPSLTATERTALEDYLVRVMPRR